MLKACVDSRMVPLTSNELAITGAAIYIGHYVWQEEARPSVSVHRVVQARVETHLLLCTACSWWDIGKIVTDVLCCES